MLVNWKHWLAGCAFLLAGLLLQACGGADVAPTPGSDLATASPTLAAATATRPPPSPTLVPATATQVPVVPSPTAEPPTLPPTLLPTGTPAPTATVPPPRPAESTATPPASSPNVAARPTATAEPDSCERTTMYAYGWRERAASRQPGATLEIAQSLQGPCVDDRWLALWALGSRHDRAALPALASYLAAHPDGDWRGDAYDLVPVARAAVAYIQAPRDPRHTYAIATLHLYAAPPHFDENGGATPAPAIVVPAGTPLVLLGEVPTGGTRPDHGGDTPVLLERVQQPGDATTYYVDISQYVAATPLYFEVPGQPAPTATP
ncbi:MAG TPA: hypothetical protein VKY74_13485 [Chloroflexia bacterium]|nr:hypothetical protein [Chloroflexia bacterium]